MDNFNLYLNCKIYCLNLSEQFSSVKCILAVVLPLSRIYVYFTKKWVIPDMAY